MALEIKAMATCEEKRENLDISRIFSTNVRISAVFSARNLGRWLFLIATGGARKRALPHAIVGSRKRALPHAILVHGGAQGKK